MLRPRSAGPMSLLLAGLVVAFSASGAAVHVDEARAVTVVHCNSWWIGGTHCPVVPGGARHTYWGGDAASASGSGTLFHKWYVAYTNSNASSPKYNDSGPVGSVLTSYFPNNTELLRGYSIHSPYNGNLFGNGKY